MEDDIRAALVDMLSAQGREDYRSGALCEFSTEYANANGWEPGVAREDDQLVCDESPVAIVLIKTEVCSCCGKLAEHFADDICADCALV